jgi:hypothetical protein
MIQREAKFGTQLRSWIRANPQRTCVFENKQTTSNSIPFNCITDDQIDYLRAVKSDKGVLVRTLGGNSEPDYIYLRNEPALIVIKYPGEFSMIDVDTWVLERDRSKRKSLTMVRAREISIRTVKLRKK